MSFVETVNLRELLIMAHTAHARLGNGQRHLRARNPEGLTHFGNLNGIGRLAGNRHGVDVKEAHFQPCNTDASRGARAAGAVLARHRSRGYHADSSMRILPAPDQRNP